MEQTDLRQVIVVSEKSEKRARIQRILQLVFDQRGEKKLHWREASNYEEAIVAIDQALAAMEEIQSTLEIVIATSGLNGRWYEATGHAQLVGKNTIKAILMGGTIQDIHEARQAGIDSVPTALPEAEVAALAAQVLFGETEDSEGLSSSSGEPVYGVFEEAP